MIRATCMAIGAALLVAGLYVVFDRGGMLIGLGLTCFAATAFDIAGGGK